MTGLRDTDPEVARAPAEINIFDCVYFLLFGVLLRVFPASYSFPLPAPLYDRLRAQSPSTQRVQLDIRPHHLQLNRSNWLKNVVLRREGCAS